MRFLRRWWWAILVGLLLIGRAVLPEVLRGQLEARASEALRASVRVGDVDLGLLRGRVALKEVVVQARDAAEDDRPLLAWKRFAVDLRWLPLFSRTIRFATVELDEPNVAVDRLQTGELNLMALRPEPEEARAEEADGDPSGWRVGVDYLALRRGGLRFRDFLIGDAEPLLLALESIEVRDIALEPEVYGTPADIKFVVKLEEGAIRTRARFTPRKEGVAVDVTLEGSRIPVHRSRVYVPGVAWSELKGLLSLALRYRLETGGRNEVSGTIGLDDLTVWTAGLDQPSLTWKSLAVALEKIDLVKHDARVKSVALSGVVLPVKPRDPEPVPVITAARAAEEAAKSRAAVDGAAPAEPAPPWTWQVGVVTVADSKARLLSDTPPLDVGVILNVKGLSGPKHDSSPLTVDLTIEDGTAALDGTLRLSPVGLAAALRTAALDVPRLVGAAGAMPAGVLQVAKLDADLQVSLGSSAPTAGDAVVSGTASIADLWVEGHDPKEFAAGAKRIAVDVQEVTVPGALAAAPVRDRATAVALRTVDVEKLYARVTRTEAGVLLPAFTSAPPPKGAAPARGAPVPVSPEAPAPADTPPPAAPAGASAAPPATVTTVAIDTVKLAKGRVDLTDRTVKPFYWTAYDPIDGELAQVRQPPLEIGSIHVVAVNTKKGLVEVKGGLTKKSDIELVVKELPLMPFNPYVTGISPYSISRGSIFVTMKASIDGSRYKTRTLLTLSDFDLASRSGKHVVLEQLGIPLTVAVALLRDWKGNIDLTIPVDVDEKGTQVGLGTIVTGALVRALVGTLTSPLKVVGFVLPRGGSGAGESLAPVPIVFAPGLATLGSAGAEQVKQLAEFLAGRPGLGVTLSAPPTPADVRGLREQALLAQLGPRKGVIGTLRNIGARGRIVDAHDARARRETAALEEDDQKALDEYLEEVPAPTAEQLRQLGEQRLAIVEKSLRQDYGIGDDQIGRLEVPPTEPAEGDPGVRVDLGSAR